MPESLTLLVLALSHASLYLSVLVSCVLASILLLRLFPSFLRIRSGFSLNPLADCVLISNCFTLLLVGRSEMLVLVELRFVVAVNLYSFDLDVILALTVS